MQGARCGSRSWHLGSHPGLQAVLNRWATQVSPVALLSKQKPTIVILTWALSAGDEGYF